MPLLRFLGGFLGYFLQIMVLVLFAGSGAGGRAENERLCPTGSPTRDKTPPEHPCSWSSSVAEEDQDSASTGLPPLPVEASSSSVLPGAGNLILPQPLLLLPLPPPFPESLCFPRCGHVFSAALRALSVIYRGRASAFCAKPSPGSPGEG